MGIGLGDARAEAIPSLWRSGQHGRMIERRDASTRDDSPASPAVEAVAAGCRRRTTGRHQSLRFSAWQSIHDSPFEHGVHDPSSRVARDVVEYALQSGAHPQTALLRKDILNVRSNRPSHRFHLSGPLPILVLGPPSLTT